MGKNDIVLAQKRAPAHAWRFSTQRRVVKPQQLALSQAPGKKFIKSSGSHQIGIKFN
jgi:hypothetical protein